MVVVDGDRFKYILHLAMDNDSNNDSIRRCRWQQFLVIFWSARGWGRDAGCGMRDAAALEHFFGGGCAPCWRNNEFCGKLNC